MAQLQFLPAFDPVKLDVELRWVVQLVTSFGTLINGALQTRSDFEACLIAGDGERALSVLDRMEANIGSSLSLIANRIAALQITRGLEAQKEEYKRIRALKVEHNTQFFAYWWSVRAEEGSSWLNFERDFERRLRAWDISDAMRAHVAFQVLGRVPAEGAEQNLLSASTSGSALDLYEAFLASARVAVLEDRSTSPLFVQTCRTLAGLIEDGRLHKILFLAGDHAAAMSLRPAPTFVRDAAFAASPTERTVAPTDIGELFHTANAADLSPRGNVPARVAHAVHQLDTAGGREQGAAELRKLAAMFDHLPLGEFIRLKASAARAYDVLGPRSARELFAVTALVDPASFNGLSPLELRALATAIGREPHDQPYWLWSRALVGEVKVDEAGPLLAATAHAHLKLMEALRSADSRNVLEATTELNTLAGQVSELSLRAEIEAVAELDGLDTALEKTVNYLLGQPSLASWLPLTWLAKQLESAEVDASNIDVPIMLDFAAKSADRKLGSARTYAAEDYLLASGALAPSDLCERIAPNAANERDRYFFGEICVPASLRTSTLFQNERELESDRIATCRWLIQAAPAEADRFEEEARELARSRHIRLGIQALQGSKLSIDRASLLRWAERNVAEDFQRYMDLLEQGIFTPDEKFRESVYAALEAGVEAPQALQIPDNEAAALFAQLTTRLLREFAIHPEHGLDAYMSLRIRHGTLSGHLRGSVEREHLVTRRNASGFYLPNDYWIERLANELEYEAVELISDTLEALSRNLDDLITRLTQELIQIRRDEKPKGMISADPAPSVLTLMIAETLPGHTFEDFFTRSEDTFWSLVQLSEPVVRTNLDQIKAETERLFDRTDESVRAIAGEGAGPLKDALLRARASLLIGIEQIGDWLTPPTTPASLVLSIEELIRVSLAVITGFYRNFAPKVEFELGELPSLPGVLRLFSDIFFIIFENVLKYSGNETDPSIRVAAWEAGDQIKFRVENSVEIVTEADVERIASATERIANGSFRRAVRGEGGTGLPKLAKVIGHGSGGGDLQFGLIEDRTKFVVEFSLRKIDVAQTTGEQG